MCPVEVFIKVRKLKVPLLIKSSIYLPRIVLVLLTYNVLGCIAVGNRNADTYVVIWS